jgi:hypothetical protein
MSNPLLEQLAVELGCSSDEAERMLHDLLADVKERTEAGEPVSLTGLGTFSLDEGTLHFDPAAALQEAVNYRNAHLEPLPVSAPSTDDESLGDEASSAAVPPVEEPPSPAETTTPSAEEPAAPQAEEEAAPAEPDEVPALSEDWTDELDEDSAEPATEPSPPADAPEPESSDEPTTGQLVGLAASIVLLVGLIWFVLGTQGIIPGPGALFQGAPSPTPPSTDTVATSPSSDTAAAAPETAPDTAAIEPDTVAPTPPSIDRATGGWTIVVASRTRPGQAEAVLSTYRQRFQGEGLPVDILTGEANGQLRYRVAVGQYATQEAAQSALQQLQGRVPSDAWSLEIQPGS